MLSYKRILSLLMAFTMLISACAFAESTEIKVYSNGNDVTDTKVFNNGVFSAVSSGSGLFAIALYKENELSKISFAQSEVELEEYRVNMVIDNADDYKMKVFRFDEDGNPLCVNSNLTPRVDDTEIYVNENFDNGIRARGAQVNGTSTVLSDGMVKVKGRGVRYGTINVPYTEKNVIFEADYMLPESGACDYVYLLATYYDDNYHPVVYLNNDGIRAGNKELTRLKRSELPTGKPFNIAVKFDLENKVYDIYYEHEKVTTAPVSVKNKLPSYDYPTGGFSFYAPMILGTNLNPSGSDTIYVDNIRVYSGTDFKDIGDARPNAHRYNFKNNPARPSEIYDRPEAEELATKAFESGHPRVIINKAKVDEIKNSTDEIIVSVRERVLSEADMYVKTTPYEYRYTTSGSIEDVGSAHTMMMYLGMAYLLTGDTKYSKRAYEEAKVLYTVPFRKKDGTAISEETRDYWNSYSYLDVAEISTIMAICYDWMYDAWTPEQKTELQKHTIEKGILRSFRGMFDEHNPTYKGDNTLTFMLTNNWGAVCNGGIFMAAIAFMEAEPYMCSQLAEANIRALEHFLPGYAPSGAWEEGTTYWAYALRYLTMMCATMESIAGTDYGIHKTEGLKESQLYALSCEGKKGVITFGDAKSGHINAPFMLYWANKYKDPQIGGARVYSMKEYDFDYGIYDLIYYNADYVEKEYVHPLTSYYKGTEVVTMAAGYDNTDPVVAISGGPGKTSHGHLDSGGVIAEKNGVRVLCDSGAEHYDATSYFSTNRYWYYKARPEGHNIFVINPQNLKDSQGKWYHGQKMEAVSEITAYSSAEKTAIMDLSEAYERDASKALRKISLDEKNVVIEDEIEVRSDGNIIEWYWHFIDTATAVVDNETQYGVTDYGTAKINEDGKSVTLTFKDFSYENSKFTYPGTVKTFTLSFESDVDFEIEIRDAVRNEYDAEKVGTLINSGKLSIDYFKSRNTISKVVVKIKNANGKVTLKTTLK